MDLKETAGPAAGEYFIFAPDPESNRAFGGAMFDNVQALEGEPLQ